MILMREHHTLCGCHLRAQWTAQKSLILRHKDRLACCDEQLSIMAATSMGQNGLFAQLNEQLNVRMSVGSRRGRWTLAQILVLRVFSSAVV